MKMLWMISMWPLVLQAQPAGEKATLKSILLEQLKTTHDQKEWFVPAKAAVDGLTAKQASWTDGSGNHSIGQLTAHLVFWNQRALSQFNGEAPPKPGVVNDETFNNFDSANWSATVRQLDEVMTGWEKAVAAASDEKITKAASTIAHIGAHNAYHIGQIIYVRKLQGVWDARNGVK